ncbi:NAD-dependent succinate-semialdehyde dehydrogenase [Mycolicibacterium sp. P9-22]|uniref:NAD-dependent succinate-semialdehyde dehydrogenase n=1 Tax=Mycolicibacterium sp. P9-22 TaxID=2024613 RepID=UPI0011EE2204|nr:NAD-dependent succinate-semialdehyde dehydrogenase [Mycolicibacterium sp. P9-22]KAA0108249.1 NAD-dependent succinate-semialdehyde dehydrogenase [Mycolicibacterium sp. P9-22]
MTTTTSIVDTVPTGLWLGGEQVDAAAGATFEVHDPATEQVLVAVADAEPEDGARALDLAHAAQPGWAATSPRARADILRRAFELLQQRSEEFAQLITLEMGKPLAESRGEVAYGAEFLRWFSEEAVRLDGRYATAPSGNGRIVVSKAPVGPVLAITPWNFPLAMGTRKIGPALAAGCTIIVKPAEETPLTMLLLGQVFAEVGVPIGVLSILPTSRAAALTAPLIGDPRLRKLTFTGSTRVGKILVRDSAKQLLRTSMELGGNAPFVVFEDADIDAAVDGAIAAKMRNGGQACTAANRIHVQRTVIDEFTEKFTARIAAMSARAGDVPGADIGPLVNADQRNTVTELVEDAVSRGARVRTGGSALDGPGFFYAPTVLDQIPDDARLLKEEIFGPVAAIAGFDTEQDGIDAANDTEYGLAAYFYTRDLDRVMRVSAALQSGMVGVNRGIISDAAAPFGGVKQSGFGREGGAEGIDEYLDTKYVAL